MFLAPPAPQFRDTEEAPEMKKFTMIALVLLVAGSVRSRTAPAHVQGSSAGNSSGLLGAAQGATVIQGSGKTAAINDHQFQGQADLRIGGDQVDAAVLTDLLSIEPGPGKSLVAKTSHAFDCGGLGSFTTMDVTRLTPVNDAGVYHLTTTAEIVSGTGTFAGATGQMHFNGTADLGTGTVNWKMHGQFK
jgi:hypothetical protein